MIDMPGVAFTTNGAHAVLAQDEPFDLDRIEAIPAAELELSTTTMMLFAIASRDVVVTGLAIRRPLRARGAIARKAFVWLVLATRRTAEGLRQRGLARGTGSRAGSHRDHRRKRPDPCCSEGTAWREPCRFGDRGQPEWRGSRRTERRRPPGSRSARQLHRRRCRIFAGSDSDECLRRGT